MTPPVHPICLITGSPHLVRVNPNPGAGSGIGAATALEFASHGYQVLACDLQPHAEQFTSQGNIHPYTMDVRDEQQVVAGIEYAITKWGRLDCAFANAGVGGPLLPFFPNDEAADWDNVLKTNVMGVYHVLKHAILAMKRLKIPGCVITTASIAGLRAPSTSMAYAASKAAVVSMSQLAAVRLAGSGIRVNCIAPGLIETAMTVPIFQLAESLPGGRAQFNLPWGYSQPRSIATVAYFLASSGAQFITGQVIAVDGGFSASLPGTMPSRNAKL